MGYSRCALPGCRSRPGQGKVFRKFPKNQNLLCQWLANLPKHFQAKWTENSYICEDHFDERQFEKVRQDGKKRLKDAAVPCARRTIPVAARKVLGDLSNSGFNDQPHSTYVPQSKPPVVVNADVERVPSVQLSDESEAAQALLMLLESADSTDCDDNKQMNDNSFPLLWDSKNDTDFDPFKEALNSTFTCDATDPSPSVVDCILDEHTGEMLPIPKSAPQNESHQEQEVTFTASWDETVGALTLDEVSGQFILSFSPVTSDDTSCATETPQCTSLEDHADPPLDVYDLVKKQSAEIERLRKLYEENNSRIVELESSVDFMGSFSQNFLQKYDSLRKSKDRLEERNKELEATLKRDTYSPWLSASQIHRLTQRKSNRGMKWEMDDIRDGLILKMRCGTSGYSAFVKRFPLLPSVSCLQRTVQFIRFDSGELHEVFDLIKSMVGGMKDTERDCQVVLDEMAIQEGERYCQSLKKWVGKSTLPSHDGIASKALVILLAGISVRWKIAVAVYFTNKRSKETQGRKNENVTGEAYTQILDGVITKAESVGLKISGISGDMGADNLAFWKAKGVTGGRNKTMVTSYSNPVRTDERIYILPDAVHLMKAVKTMLENNKTVTLPPEIVEEEGLESAEVNYNHIEELMEFEDGCELKVAFRLRKNNVKCDKQFKKMNVGTTKAVLCHRTGVGLNLMSQEIGDASYRTTAWFIILLNTFFTVVTGRHGTLGVSHKNPTAFGKVLALFKKIDHIFHFMRVGKNGDYKPVQRGVRVLCASLLGLMDYFLKRRNYRYLLLGRFTSDCIENLFSCIRLCQPVPHAVAFLQTLKVITLAQFSEAVQGSSYEYEECSPIACVDFLEEARRRAKERAMETFLNSLDELSRHSIRKLEEKDYALISNWEKKVVYDMAGSTIAGVQSSGMVVCNVCISATKWKGENHHPASIITEMKEFSLLKGSNEHKNLQIYVSDHVFKAILTAEISFRLYREKTINFECTDVKQYFVENLMYVWDGSEIPNCHGLGRKILNVFIDGRLKEFGKIRREKLKSNASNTLSVQRSSKSIAMHAAADQITVSGSQQSNSGH